MEEELESVIAHTPVRKHKKRPSAERVPATQLESLKPALHSLAPPSPTSFESVKYHRRHRSDSAGIGYLEPCECGQTLIHGCKAESIRTSLLTLDY